MTVPMQRRAATRPAPRAAIRPTRRGATVLAGFVLSLVMLEAALSMPAAAATSSYEAAQPLGLLRTLLLFVGGPVGLFLLIWLLVVAGQLSRRPRRESDLSWFHDMTDDAAASPAELTGTADAPERTDESTMQQPEPAAPANPEAVTERSGSTRATPSG